jgi:hypothetical protein
MRTGRYICPAGLGLKSMSTACTRSMNGPRVSALRVALFVMCQYSLITHAQNGRSSAAYNCCRCSTACYPSSLLKTRKGLF